MISLDRLDAAIADLEHWAERLRQVRACLAEPPQRRRSAMGGGMQARRSAAPRVDATPMRSCRACKVLKPASQFYAERRVASGLKATCKDCYAERQRAIDAQRRAKKAAHKGNPPARPAAAEAGPSRRAAIADTAPPRAPEQPPSKRLAVLKRRITAWRKDAPIARATLRCRTCGEELLGSKASQHAFEVHGQRVVHELLRKSFDLVADATKEAA